MAKICVVEDCQVYAKAITDILTEADHEVLTCLERKDIYKVAQFGPTIWVLSHKLFGWGLDGGQIARDFKVRREFAISTSPGLGDSYCAATWYGKEECVENWRMKVRMLSPTIEGDFYDSVFGWSSGMTYPIEQTFEAMELVDLVARATILER